jgi:hypothetical protein
MMSDGLEGAAGDSLALIKDNVGALVLQAVLWLQISGLEVDKTVVVE